MDLVDIGRQLTILINRFAILIKLDLEKERDVVKFLWDECIPHEFGTF